MSARPSRLGAGHALLLNLPLAIGFAFGLARDLASPSSVLSTDFSVFWSGWWLILHGRGAALYDEAAQRAAQHMVMGGRSFEGGLMAFLNPPHAALAGVPFGWLADGAGERVAFLLWTAGNLLLLARLDRLARQAVGATAGLARWMVTAAVIGFAPVLYAVSIGQLSLLLAVAALELSRALEDDRPLAAACWLLVFSVKPQLLPPLLALLAVRRRWAVLGRAGGLAAALALVTGLALGPGIWWSYARNVHGLERFFGSGTPVYMMSLRGALARLAGGQAHEVYATAVAVWLLTTAALAVVLARRPAAAGEDARARQRGELALALAVALFTSPHLFQQDAAIWVAALALHVSSLHLGGRPWLPFARFALAWPLLFALARALDLSAPHGRPPPVSLAVVVMAIALVLMAREARGA
jgi:hypothetical protein